MMHFLKKYLLFLFLNLKIQKKNTLKKNKSETEI